MAQDDRPLDWAKIARTLDGGEEPLSPTEAETAEQTRDDLAWLGDRLTARAPDAVLLRVAARVDQALAPPARRRRPVWTAVLGSAAAAAAVAAIVLTMLIAPPPARTPRVAGLTDEEAIQLYVADDPSGIDIQMDLLDEKVACLAADLELEEVTSLDLELDAVGEQIENFWLDPLAAELDADPEL